MSAPSVPVQLIRDHHKAGFAARDQLLAMAVTEEQAQQDGYHSISSGWAIRRHDQCLELVEAVRNLGEVAFKLVLKERRISIWRKR